MAKKSGVPGSVRRAVFKRDNYTCLECKVVGSEIRHPRGAFGYPTTIAGIYLSIDHIIAKSKGGGHGEQNLRTLCTRCNSKKGAN